MYFFPEPLFGDDGVNTYIGIKLQFTFILLQTSFTPTEHLLPISKHPKSFRYISYHYPNVCSVPRHEIRLTSFGPVPNTTFKKNNKTVIARPFLPVRLHFQNNGVDFHYVTLASFTKICEHIPVLAEIGQK
jgi:hypothetical protein